MTKNLSIWVLALCVAVVAMATPTRARVVRNADDSVTCEVQGVSYEPLEVMDMGNPCKQCVCSEVDGEAACVEIQCPRAPCGDPVDLPGMCCPVCFAMLSGERKWK